MRWWSEAAASLLTSVCLITLLPCRVAVLDKVTDFLLFLGKLFISGSVGEFYPPSFIFSSKNKRTLAKWCTTSSLLCLFFFFIWPLCCFPGALAFFFFTRKIPIFQEEVPSLNYFWVPPLVRHTVAFAAFDQLCSIVTWNTWNENQSCVVSFIYWCIYF